VEESNSGSALSKDLPTLTVMADTQLPRTGQTQKVILALDGGGMRGALTLGFLGELKSLIARGTENQNDYVLANYFDFNGVMSAGPR
jgi:hypothetical protein